MRRPAAFTLLMLCAVPLLSLAAPKPSRRPEPQAQAPQLGLPPHAWLFGTWTGGLFPVLEGMVAQDCRSQPTMLFAQDVVAHASLTNPDLTRRVIESVRTSPAGAEFRFNPDPEDMTGFGCDSPNALHVARETNDRISFPNCAAFPYPLERCPRG